MKTYVLLKELPYAKMGTIFYEGDKDYSYEVRKGVGTEICFSKWVVENTPEWFERVFVNRTTKIYYGREEDNYGLAEANKLYYGNKSVDESAKEKTTKMNKTTYILQKELPDSKPGDEYILDVESMMYYKNGEKMESHWAFAFVENNPEWFKRKPEWEEGKITYVKVGETGALYSFPVNRELDPWQIKAIEKFIKVFLEGGDMGFLCMIPEFKVKTEKL